jgi:penicillin-binding protein 1A
MTIAKLFFKRGLWSLLSLALMGFILSLFAFIYMESFLPNVETLRHVQLQVPLRIFTADGKLIAEYGQKRRIPVTLDQVPKPLIKAVLATEDQRFFEHPGVDVMGLARAAVRIIQSGAKTQGGSTITMQVARNFFLSRKKTYLRKFNEILLALKIDHELSKDKILELYLNKIYFGNRAYGIATAARVYYGKPLAQLTLPQMAMLAGLPKAPSKINPLANPKAALKRRNHVLTRMLEVNYIDKATYDDALQTPLTASYHGRQIEIHAPYIAEMIRQAMAEHYGEKAYTEGFQVYTTINARLQRAAQNAVHTTLLSYDKRHGYRGPFGHLGDPAVEAPEDIITQLKKIAPVNGLQPAAVITLTDRQATCLLANGQAAVIKWPQMRWARPTLDKGQVGPRPQSAKEILNPGDVIRVQSKQGKWWLAQLPKAQGALVTLNPNNGAIEALVGGFNYDASKFNRATQAYRQPGSSFKPFVYAAALAKGFTLASVINDAPVVKNDPSLETLWRPQNDTKIFYGPTRLRIALIRSRNLVSIRLLQAIGIPYTLNFLKRFGFEPNKLPKTLSLALGSATVTPLQLATAYATFANGGYRIEPFIIDHINNAEGVTELKIVPKTTDPSAPANQRAARVLSPQVAYLMTLAMRDVIQHGTGRAARVLKRDDLAGKTGTTNEQNDAWFSGFNGDLVTTCWMGFDTPQSLHEYASASALPMWIDFMRLALSDKPAHPLAQPANLITVRIDPRTGMRARPGQGNAIFETFRSNHVPKRQSSQVRDDNEDAATHLF